MDREEFVNMIIYMIIYICVLLLAVGLYMLSYHIFKTLHPGAPWWMFFFHG